MSEPTKTTTSKLTRKPLSSKMGGKQSTVKQSFSHGRSKSVVVEKKRSRRIVRPGDKTIAPTIPTVAPEEEVKVDKLEEEAAKRGITKNELLEQIKAVKQRQVEEEKRATAEKEAADARERLKDEQERKAREEKEREEAESKRKTENEDSEEEDRKEKEKKKPSTSKRVTTKKDEPSDESEKRAESSSGRGKKSKSREKTDRTTESVSKPKSKDRRRQGKLRVADALGDDEDRQRSLASVRRARERERERRMASATDKREKIATEVTLPETITLQDLAGRMNERVTDIVKFMMQQGEIMRGIDIVDADTAELIAAEFGHTVKRVSESDVEIGLSGDEDDPKELRSRPPVVTVMGHVDHGKTSLLDALRQSDIAAGEAGGITQHIGAYQVTMQSGDRVTFIDTPGHAAFSAMRARGANVTDVVILVVAADDGAMPQTVEAINHAKAAKVPMIVAVNKVDLEGADSSKVLTDLLQYDVQVEELGGDVQAVPVSALEKVGLDELMEAITLQAELLELNANPNRSADGVVIESTLDKGRGPIATVLVKRGTLQRGDIVVAGTCWGKVRALVDERDQQISKALPSQPAEILGLNGAPDPGDLFNVVESEARAREITEYRQRQKRNVAGQAGVAARVSLEQMLQKFKQEESVAKAKGLPLVLKADMQGSVEAIKHSLDNISNEEVVANVVHGAVGGISASDVSLAQSSNAPILAFNVRANKQARYLAEREGVEIRYYSIIYDLINDIKDTLSGLLAPEKRERFIGYAEILEVFNISKTGKVAGCLITEGTVKRGCGVRLLRDNVVIHEGSLKTLKRFKDEVPEVTSGTECGMAFENYEDIRKGDRIECFEVEEIERKLA